MFRRNKWKRFSGDNFEKVIFLDVYPKNGSAPCSTSSTSASSSRPHKTRRRDGSSCVHDVALCSDASDCDESDSAWMEEFIGKVVEELFTMCIVNIYMSELRSISNSLLFLCIQSKQKSGFRTITAPCTGKRILKDLKHDNKSIFIPIFTRNLFFKHNIDFSLTRNIPIFGI